MNQYNINYFENQIYLEKKLIQYKNKNNQNKSYQEILEKTLLLSKFDLDKLISNTNINTNINYSLKIKKIYLELNVNSDDYGFIESLISNMKISINTSPDLKFDKKRILSVPGYICGFRFIEPKLLELDIWFENFLPNGLPFPIYNNDLPQLPNPVHMITGLRVYDNSKKNFYLIILFNNLVRNDLILSSYNEYELIKTNLDDNENYYICEQENYQLPNHFNINQIINFIGHKLIFIQDTQTENVLSSEISSSILKINIPFNFMCRGFWFKMHKIDYDNLKRFKIMINGQNRCNFDIFQLELLELNKKYIDNCVVCFFNLEFNSKEWGLPKTISKSKEIYSNSLNLSRIDSTKFIFEFESDLLASEYISITSLNNNLLGIQNIKYEEVFPN